MNRATKLWRGINDWRWGAAIALLASPLAAPELLAFPHVAESNGDRIYSDMPIDAAALDRLTGRADALVGQSPIAQPSETRTIFLTNGGWRWTWAAAMSADSLAIARPFGRETIVVNKSDLAADRIATAFGTRSLSGVLAHEKCHGMERRAFGLFVDWSAPHWLREGYCDHVAGESTLTAEQAKRLRGLEKAKKPLRYYDGRQRVERELAANGGNIGALFEKYSR